MATQFVMKAFNTSINQHVSWTSIGTPDFAGIQSGFSPSNLINIALDFTLSDTSTSGSADGGSAILDGDVTGISSANTVAKIQGVPVSNNSVANDGFALVSKSNTWVPTGVETVFNLKNFGAKGDGTTIDDAAIAACITAAIGSILSGSTVGTAIFAPPGVYVITQPITFANVEGLHFYGSHGQTIFLWRGTNYTGSSPKPMMLVQDSYRSRFEGFQLLAQGGIHVAYGIQTTTHTNTPTNTSNHFENIQISGTTDEIEQCVYIGGGTLAVQNDFGRWVNIRFANFSKDAIEIHDSQCYNHQFENCVSIANQLTTTGASISNSGFTLTTPSHFFQAKDIGKTIEISVGGSILRTTITAASGISTCTVNDAWTFSTASGTASVLYSGQTALRCSAGSFQWEGGAMSNSLFTDIYLAINDADACSVKRANNENSRCCLFTGGNTTAVKGLNFQSCRFSSAGAVTYTPFVNITMPGNFTFQDCNFGDPLDGPGSPAPVQISYLPQGTAFSYWQFSLRNCVITSSLPYGIGPSSVFAGAAPQIIDNCRLQNSTTSVLIGPPDLKYSFGGSPMHIDFGVRTFWKQDVGANSIIDIDDIYTGADRPCRLLLHYTGYYTTTWNGPGGSPIDWGTAGPPQPGFPGHDDEFEFRYDGTVCKGYRVSSTAKFAFNVKDFGAVGDGATNDATAIQTAINTASAIGAELFFPPTGSNYLCQSAITIPSYTRLVGSLTQNSGVTNIGSVIAFSGSGVGFVMNGQNVHISHLTVVVGSAAGPAFKQPFGNSGGYWHFEHVSVINGNKNVSALILGTNGNGTGIQNNWSRFSNFDILAAAQQAVPLIQMYGVNGGLGFCEFRNCTWTGGGLVGSGSQSTAEFVHVEATDSGTLSNINFYDVSLEVPVAGGYVFKSVQFCRITGGFAGDLGGNPNTAPLILIDKSTNTGAVASKGVLIDTIFTDIGSNPGTAGFETVLVPFASGQGIVTILNSIIPSIGNGGPGLNPITVISSQVTTVHGDKAVGVNQGYTTSFADIISESTLILNAGLNSDAGPTFFTGFASSVGAVGGPVTLGGLSLGVFGTGVRFTLYYNRNNPLTIKNADGGSSFPIKTGTGADLVLGNVALVNFIYDATDHWVVTSTWPIQTGGDLAGSLPNPTVASITGSAGNVNFIANQTTLDSSSSVPIIGAVVSTQTTSASPVVAVTYIHADNSIVDWVVTFAGRDTSNNGDYYRADFTFTTQRFAAGAPTLNPASPVATNVRSNGGGSAYLPTITISSNNILLNVVGTSATVNWSTTYQAQQRL